MFGFLGTMTGMIGAFNAIAAAGSVEPSLVASGISEALITTAGGLIIAIPIQFANNMFLMWIDSFVINMQESSNSLVDALIEMKHNQ
jgi:biopolymer transport protein ExbB